MNIKRFCPYCQHLLLKKSIENRQRLFCPECKMTLYENPIPATAAIIIQQNNEILLVKRKAEPQKGKWCLPGGFIEMEETPEHCCQRELKEETNLEAEIDSLMGVYLSENSVYKSVLIIGFLMKNIRGQLIAGDDSDEVGYFDLDDLPLIAFKSHQSLIDDVSRLLKRDHPRLLEVNKKIQFGAYIISSLNHVDIIEKACQAGARIVQYRDKISSRRQMLETAKIIRGITRKHHTLFIVNDYIDIALMSRADGLHLGQDDIPLKEARRITPDNFLIGISTHSLDQALTARDQGADYIAIGPVFSTPTKQNYLPVGIKLVCQVVKSVSIPIVAIGGLNLKNILDLHQVGIENVAMLREFQHDTVQVVKEINHRLLEI